MPSAGRMTQAPSLAAAVHRDGSNSYARLIYGFHLLKTGRILEGLSNWSASDTLAGIYPLRRYRPSWAGEPLGSRSSLVLFEHGFGDMIQMSRFLPRLRAREPEAIDHGPGSGGARRAAGPCLSDYRIHHGRRAGTGLRSLRPLDAVAGGARRNRPRATQHLHRPRSAAPRVFRRASRAVQDRDLLARTSSPVRSDPLDPARPLRQPVPGPRLRLRRPAEQPHGRGGELSSVAWTGS